MCPSIKPGWGHPTEIDFVGWLDAPIQFFCYLVCLTWMTAHPVPMGGVLVLDLCDAAGNPEAEKLKEFYDAILLHLDLLVGYAMGLDQLVKLLQDSLQAEKKDKVGGAKTTTTILEGSIGSCCRT